MSFSSYLFDTTQTTACIHPPFPPGPPPPHPTYDLDAVIKLALAEDLGDAGDVTTAATIPIESTATATFVAKASGVLAGRAVVDMVCGSVDPTLVLTWAKNEGDQVQPGDRIGTIQGSTRAILIAERLSLNFLQRMSGIATITHAMATAARPARVLETRKTLPGLRLVDKWAVLIGGGLNHRIGLFDMAMVKDNHVSACGGIAACLQRLDAALPGDTRIICEVRSLTEVQEALDYVKEFPQSRLQRLLLDNMVQRRFDGSLDVSMLRDAVTLVGSSSPQLETEASGNVTLESVGVIGQTGVTYVSSGALTHSVKALDISLLLEVERNYRANPELRSAA